MKQKSSSIYDIAKEAGVSIATVSRVLRGENNVLPETRRKVETAIAQNHYQPSAIARGLTSRHTNSLGIVLPRLTNPNYAMIFTGADDAARTEGYVLSLFPWKNLEFKGYNAAEVLTERRLDGVIVCVEYVKPESYEPLCQSLMTLSRYMPVTLIGCVPPELKYPTISYNLCDCVREVVAYLTGLGHERICMLGGVKEDHNARSRDRGYRDALIEARLLCIEQYRVYGNGTAEAGEEMLNDMLSSLLPTQWPTAVIAINDMVALGVLRAAKKRGLRVPEDLSVIGCDNLFCAAYAEPALTSIDMHQQFMGRRAVEMLLHEERRGREDAPWELVFRDSCARVGR